MEALNYINSYRKTLLDHINKIKNDLPLIDTDNSAKHINGLLYTIQYKDLNNWDTKSMNTNGKSKNLILLASKIERLILEKHDTNSIIPFLKSITNDKIKVWSINNYKRNKRREKNKSYNGENIIIGHFRHNYKGITLTSNEINKIKSYFNL